MVVMFVVVLGVCVLFVCVVDVDLFRLVDGVGWCWGVGDEEWVVVEVVVVVFIGEFECCI